MQQSMRLNKKREETQGGFEEQLMSSELKWMALADATDLNITNWGFMPSIKNPPVKSFHPAAAEENLLTA